MNIIIRCALPQDLESAFAVESASFPDNECATISNFEKRIATFPNTFLLAVTEGGNIVGVLNSGCWDHPYFDDILYQDITSHKPDGIYQAIYGLSVLPAYRKYGIAKKLISQIIEIAKFNNKKGIILSCKDELLKYYEQFGFENKGPSHSNLGGKSWNDMILIFQDNK